MADHTVIGIRAAIKALKDVVSPAVDATNPLAAEQLRMVCAFLAMVCEQLPYRSDRIRFEFEQAMGLALALATKGRNCDAEIVAALDLSIERARALIDRADAPERELQALTAALSAAAAALIRAAGDADGATRGAIEREVLSRSKRWLDVQRAWFLPLGFDSESAGLAPISVLLAAARVAEKPIQPPTAS